MAVGGYRCVGLGGWERWRGFALLGLAVWGRRWSECQQECVTGGQCDLHGRVNYPVEVLFAGLVAGAAFAGCAESFAEEFRAPF